MAFLVICVGITILQMSKVDPVKLTGLDRKSTILLQAARSSTGSMEEKSVLDFEDPGMDAIRGSFGPVGSIIRARSARRLSQSGGGPNTRGRSGGLGVPGQFDGRSWISDGLSAPGTPPQQPIDLLAGMKRHQLWDAPVPDPLSPPPKAQSLLPVPDAPGATESARRPTIKFDDQALVHSYHHPGTGDNSAKHERRSVLERIDTPRASGTVVASKQLSPIQDTPEGTVNVVTAPLLDDKTIHSAPPTVSPRFSYGRPDARDIFNNLQSSSSGTLLFSPVSGSEEEVTSTPRGRKRYPKGAGDDDREESISLFPRQPVENDEGDDATSSAAGGGIRLVQTKPRG
jgi:magnesium transporter